MKLKKMVFNKHDLMKKQKPSYSTKKLKTKEEIKQFTLPPSAY